MVGIVNKPDINYGIWASNGDVAVPSSEKVEIGHIVEKPKKEIVNWIENRQDQFMAYLNQVGIPEWDSKTTYKANISFVNRSGTVYKAKSQNIDKDPTLNQDIWEISWATYSDFYTLFTDVNNIKTVDEYLDFYVSKANPIMTAPSQGVAYGFTDDSDTGLVKDSGGNPSIQKDGVVVASFDQLEQENSVVRFSDLRKYLELYKVGDLYTTTVNENPSVRLGYGTWTRFAEGRTLVGFSSDVSNTIPEWVKTSGSEFGEYNHKLTVEELAKHEVNFENIWAGTNPPDKVETYSISEIGWEKDRSPDIHFLQKSKPIGGDKSHNNVQPSKVVFIWLRTS